MPEAGADCLLGILSSLAFDYVARQKVGGTAPKYFTMRQLPVLEPTTFEQKDRWVEGRTVGSWFRDRTLELTYTAWDVQPFAKDCGYDGPPFRWDEDRRFLLRYELDAAFFHLYSVDSDDVDYILETPPAIHQHDCLQLLPITSVAARTSEGIRAWPSRNRLI